AQPDPAPEATEKLNPVVAAIPAQRRDSRPSPAPSPLFVPAQPVAPAQPVVPAPAPGVQHRARLEHLPTENHPVETASTSERTPQSRLRAAQLLVQRTTDLRAVPKAAVSQRPEPRTD